MPAPFSPLLLNPNSEGLQTAATALTVTCLTMSAKLMYRLPCLLYACLQIALGQLDH